MHINNINKRVAGVRVTFLRGETTERKKENNIIYFSRRRLRGNFYIDERVRVCVRKSVLMCVDWEGGASLFVCLFVTSEGSERTSASQNTGYTHVYTMHGIADATLR